MISRYEAYLNEVALSSISPDILVLNIEYSPPETQYVTFNVANRNGARIHKDYTASVSVQITFEIHNYDTLKRQAICQNVALWAKNGGYLETNDRLGQRLRCVCTQKPALNSRDWTAPVTIVFTAYVIPFWEQEVPASITLTAGTSGSGQLYVPGNVDGALAEVDILANASLSSVSLTVNGSTLSLTGLSISSENTVKIAYDDQMIQSIKVGTTSLLNKRTGADDLVMKCGEYNTVSFSSSASVTVTFKARGLWA